MRKDALIKSAILLIGSLLVFSSCDLGCGCGDPIEGPLQEETDILTLAGGWSKPVSVLSDTGVTSDGWSDFAIEFFGRESGGHYTVSNVPEGFEDVLADGVWHFGNESGTVLIRIQNEVETPMSVTISSGELSMAFDVDDKSGVNEGIGGSWVFVFNN